MILHLYQGLQPVVWEEEQLVQEWKVPRWRGMLQIADNTANLTWKSESLGHKRMNKKQVTWNQRRETWLQAIWNETWVMRWLHQKWGYNEGNQKENKQIRGCTMRSESESFYCPCTQHNSQHFWNKIYCIYYICNIYSKKHEDIDIMYKERRELFIQCHLFHNCNLAAIMGDKHAFKGKFPPVERRYISCYATEHPAEHSAALLWGECRNTSISSSLHI